MLAEIEFVLEEAKAEVSATTGSAKIGPLRVVVLQTINNLTLWHRYMGGLPPSLKPAIELSYLVDTMCDVLERHNLAPEVIEGLLAALDNKAA